MGNTMPIKHFKIITERDYFLAKNIFQNHFCILKFIKRVTLDMKKKMLLESFIDAYFF